MLTHVLWYRDLYPRSNKSDKHCITIHIYYFFFLFVQPNNYDFFFLFK